MLSIWGETKDRRDHIIRRKPQIKVPGGLTLKANQITAQHCMGMLAAESKATHNSFIRPTLIHSLLKSFIPSAKPSMRRGSATGIVLQINLISL